MVSNMTKVERVKKHLKELGGRADWDAFLDHMNNSKNEKYGINRYELGHVVKGCPDLGKEGREIFLRGGAKDY